MNAEVSKERFRRFSGETQIERVRPFFHDFHKLSMSGDYEYPVHRHADYEVIVVKRGPYRCNLNDLELSVPDGAFLIVKPGDWHQDHLTDGQFHYVLHFSLGTALFRSQAQLRLFSSAVTPGQQVGSGEVPDAEHFFSMLERELTQSDAFSICQQDALLETFFWQLVRLLPAAALSASFRNLSEQLDFVSRIRRVFEEHVGAGVTVDEMASQLGVSRRTLSTRCQEFLGESPARAFSRYKIDRAAELLRYTDKPVKEISFELGYENAFHFSRTFKRILGESPVAYRSTQT